MSNFWQRAITGTLFVVVLVSAILLDEQYIAAVLGLIVLFGLLEFYKLFENSDVKPQRITGTIIGTAFYVFPVITHFVNLKMKMGEISVMISFTALVLIACIELFRAEKKPFENIAVTFAGIVYVSLPFLLLTLLGTPGGRGGEWYNPWGILSIFVLVWCNDTFAYLTGRLIGKHKLFERISPKKTWEGFIGGVVFAVLGGVAMAYFLEWSYVKMITYGLVVGIIGTAGDLVESMLKRSVGVKDSGNILPGHGGILDRFDAVIFVVPVIFALENTVFRTF